MTPSEIRAELLEQHEKLRCQMDELRSLAGRIWSGDPLDIAMHEGLARLEAALAEHNAREEELLKDIIPTADAWGPVRAEVMGDAHRDEHAALQGALSTMRATPMKFLELVELFERLLEHMEREERDFLGEDVLKDDAIVVDSTG